MLLNPAPVEKHLAARRRRGRRAPQRRRQPSRIGARLATLALLLALAIALLIALPGLSAVRHQIGHIKPIWIATAVGLELASDLSFVVLFRLIFNRVPARDARLLAWTNQSAGALLPGGGVGSLAIGGWLMHLTGAPTGWIVRRSEAFFWLTTATNAATVIGAGIALMLQTPGSPDFALVVLPTLLVTAATLAVAALPRLVRGHQRAPRWIQTISIGVHDAEQTTFTTPSWRLISAFGYLLFDMAVLWLCLTAVGPAPSIPALILAYNIGYLTNWLPIPGGIGALDAGLTGALVLYGIPATHAATAVIVYHGISLLLPAVGGMLAYLRLRPRLTGARPRTPEPSG